MPVHREIEDRICRILPNLAGSQIKAADFFLEHMDLVALLPGKEIAKRAGISEATLVRFAQTLGFRGHKELKEKLSATLETRLSLTEQYRIAVAEKEKTPDTLKRAAQNGVSNIQDTIKSIDPRAFSNIVDAIISARRIYCLGLEISSHLAQLMTFFLRLYSYDAQYLSLDYFRYREQVAYLTDTDLLIAFSFSPYSRETIEALQQARERGLKSIAFTDKKIAPIHAYASFCIQIKTDNITFSNSLGAVVTVINAIIDELNFKDKKRTLRALQTIESSILDERYFIAPEM
jgi:DNA-binding MurR/RpiR family transcriptional regulator